MNDMSMEGKREQVRERENERDVEEERDVQKEKAWEKGELQAGLEGEIGRRRRERECVI